MYRLFTFFFFLRNSIPRLKIINKYENKNKSDEGGQIYGNDVYVFSKPDLLEKNDRKLRSLQGICRVVFWTRRTDTEKYLRIDLSIDGGRRRRVREFNRRLSVSGNSVIAITSAPAGGATRRGKKPSRSLTVLLNWYIFVIFPKRARSLARSRASPGVFYAPRTFRRPSRGLYTTSRRRRRRRIICAARENASETVSVVEPTTPPVLCKPRFTLGNARVARRGESSSGGRGSIGFVERDIDLETLLRAARGSVRPFTQQSSNTPFLFVPRIFFVRNY